MSADMGAVRSYWAQTTGTPAALADATNLRIESGLAAPSALWERSSGDPCF